MDALKSAVVVAVSAALSLTVSAAREKVIYGHGWDILDASPEDLLANVEELDKTPLEGMSIVLRGVKRPDGTVMNPLGMRGDKAWTIEPFAAFDGTIGELKKHRSMKHSMLCVFWGTGERLAWKDDAKWAAFAESMSVVARLAKRWGLEGIMIDPEDYNHKNQFVRTKDGDWEEMRRLARRRGRQMSEAIFGAYPECRLLPFWTFSSCDPTTLYPDPDRIATAYYDVRPDFFNGMMDGLSEKGEIYDGDEFAYILYGRADNNDFYHHAWRMKEGVRDLVAPENLDRFDRQWHEAFGIYPDMHIAKQGSAWCFPRGPGELAPNVLFSLNMEQSVKVSRRYVWVYGEHRAWIRWKGAKFKRYNDWGLWEDAIPGFFRSIRYAKDFHRAFGEDLAAGTVKPCADERQAVEGKGEGGAYKALIVGGAKEGEQYAVRFRTKGAHARAWVFWHVDGKFERGIWPVDIGAAAKPDAEGFYVGEGLVRVPLRRAVRNRNVDGLEVRLFEDYDAAEPPSAAAELKVYPVLKAVYVKE